MGKPPSPSDGHRVQAVDNSAKIEARFTEFTQPLVQRIQSFPLPNLGFISSRESLDTIVLQLKSEIPLSFREQEKELREKTITALAAEDKSSHLTGPAKRTFYEEKINNLIEQQFKDRIIEMVLGIMRSQLRFIIPDIVDTEDETSKNNKGLKLHPVTRSFDNFDNPQNLPFFIIENTKGKLYVVIGNIAKQSPKFFGVSETSKGKGLSLTPEHDIETINELLGRLPEEEKHFIKRVHDDFDKAQSFAAFQAEIKQTLTHAHQGTFVPALGTGNLEIKSAETARNKSVHQLARTLKSAEKFPHIEQLGEIPNHIFIAVAQLLFALSVSLKELSERKSKAGENFRKAVEMVQRLQEEIEKVEQENISQKDKKKKKEELEAKTQSIGAQGKTFQNREKIFSVLLEEEKKRTASTIQASAQNPEEMKMLFTLLDFLVDEKQLQNDENEKYCKAIRELKTGIKQAFSLPSFGHIEHIVENRLNHVVRKLSRILVPESSCYAGGRKNAEKDDIKTRIGVIERDTESESTTTILVKKLSAATHSPTSFLGTIKNLLRLPSPKQKQKTKKSNPTKAKSQQLKPVKDETLVTKAIRVSVPMSEFEIAFRTGEKSAVVQATQKSVEYLTFTNPEDISWFEERFKDIPHLQTYDIIECLIRKHFEHDAPKGKRKPYTQGTEVLCRILQNIAAKKEGRINLEPFLEKPEEAIVEKPKSWQF